MPPRSGQDLRTGLAGPDFHGSTPVAQPVVLSVRRPRLSTAADGGRPLYSIAIWQQEEVLPVSSRADRPRSARVDPYGRRLR